MVSSEYNRTPLATEEGWIHTPTECELREMLAVARCLPENGALLDIGTGRGIGPRFARELGAKVYSVDSVHSGGLSAIENVRMAGVECYFCDVLEEPLPFDGAIIDCVLFTDVIEHLLHSPKQVLREIRRVLKPGGFCVVTTPNATRLTVRLKVLLGLSNWSHVREYFEKPFHGGHHHEYTIEEFRWAFETMNFTIVSFELFENNLRPVQIQSVDEIATRMRGKRVPRPEPLRFRLAKAPFIALTSMFRTLRSDMLMIGQKSERGYVRGGSEGVSADSSIDSARSCNPVV